MSNIALTISKVAEEAREVCDRLDLATRQNIRLKKEVTDKNYECSQLRAKLEAVEKEVEILRGRTVCSYPSFDGSKSSPANPPEGGQFAGSNPVPPPISKPHLKEPNDNLYTWDCLYCQFNMNDSFDFCWHCGREKKYEMKKCR